MRQSITQYLLGAPWVRELLSGPLLRGTHLEEHGNGESRSASKAGVCALLRDPGGHGTAQTVNLMDGKCNLLWRSSPCQGVSEHGSGQDGPA